MKSIVIVGMTGEGKSEIIKTLIAEEKSCLAFDLNDEYGEKTKYLDQIPLRLASDTSLRRSRYIGGDFSEFVDIAFTKKDTIVVFEECTGFLTGRVEDKFKRLVVNKMFTRNVYVFIFHSIIDVPPFIMRLSNICLMFKTNDERHFIEKKYPRMLPYFDRVNSPEHPNGHCIKIKMI